VLPYAGVCPSCELTQPFADIQQHFLPVCIEPELAHIEDLLGVSDVLPSQRHNDPFTRFDWREIGDGLDCVTAVNSGNRVPEGSTRDFLRGRHVRTHTRRLRFERRLQRRFGGRRGNGRGFLLSSGNFGRLNIVWRFRDRRFGRSSSEGVLRWLDFCSRRIRCGRLGGRRFGRRFFRDRGFRCGRLGGWRFGRRFLNDWSLGGAAPPSRSAR
jgi:hypothetical protein